MGHEPLWRGYQTDSMRAPLPSMECHFFTEKETWLLRVNSPVEQGFVLTRERRLFASVTGSDWERLERAVCESADNDNLEALSELMAGSLVNGSELLPVPVRGRVTDLLARYLRQAHR